VTSANIQLYPSNTAKSAGRGDQLLKLNAMLRGLPRAFTTITMRRTLRDCETRLAA
jgi:hypothetical protein